MKYKNVLGKDFKHHAEAKKFYVEKRKLFKLPEKGYLIKLNETTPIKKSQLDYLFINYPSKDEEYLKRKFKNKHPVDWYMAFVSKATNHDAHGGELAKSLAFRLNESDKETLNNGVETVSFKAAFDCFGTTDKNKFSLIQKAARWEVDDQIKKIKEIKNCVCNRCNVQHSWENVEAHHVVPFKEIFDEFLKEIVDKDKDVIETIKVKFSAKFKDREQAKRWKDFHKNVAQLEVLCKWCHEEETHG